MAFLLTEARCGYHFEPWFTSTGLNLATHVRTKIHCLSHPKKKRETLLVWHSKEVRRTSEQISLIPQPGKPSKAFGTQPDNWPEAYQATFIGLPQQRAPYVPVLIHDSPFGSNRREFP